MAEQAIATVVGPETVIRGELRCAGDLVVHGSVEGIVSCGGMLRLAPGGTIEAEVRARGAVRPSGSAPPRRTFVRVTLVTGPVGAHRA